MLDFFLLKWDSGRIDRSTSSSLSVPALFHALVFAPGNSRFSLSAAPCEAGCRGTLNGDRGLPAEASATRCGAIGARTGGDEAARAELFAERDDRGLDLNSIAVGVSFRRV